MLAQATAMFTRTPSIDEIVDRACELMLDAVEARLRAVEVEVSDRAVSRSPDGARRQPGAIRGQRFDYPSIATIEAAVPAFASLVARVRARRATTPPAIHSP